MERALPIVKLATIVAFMVTLCATYYLRSEVLTLNKIRYSADNVRAEEQLREMKETYPVRLAETFPARIYRKDSALPVEHGDVGFEGIEDLFVESEIPKFGIALLVDHLAFSQRASPTITKVQECGRAYKKQTSRYVISTDWSVPMPLR